jgi:nicotinamidase-related amidase
MLQVSLDKLVDFGKIGEPTNQPISESLKWLGSSKVKKAKEDKEKTLLLAIDVQNDFMDKGALGVPGAIKDVERLLHFIYHHFENITHIMTSLDTHKPQQIFHPSWWENKEGKEPEPFTIITYADVEAGEWIPRYESEKSKRYVQKLEESSKKQLCIWPYHCIKGTFGVSLEGQFAQLAYLHSIMRDYELKTVVKGEDPLSEMYGIIQPEYSEKDLVRRDILEEIANYDKVIVAGEAKSHCVLETMNQIVTHLKDNRSLLENIYVLTDCMSSIPGYEEDTEKAFQQLHEEYGIQLITTDEYGK